MATKKVVTFRMEPTAPGRPVRVPSSDESGAPVAELGAGVGPGIGPASSPARRQLPIPGLVGPQSVTREDA
jgi:hypothetical protein